jgi:hypothetical protein
VAARIKSTKAMIASNNLLFAHNLSNYELQLYPIHAYNNRDWNRLFRSDPTNMMVRPQAVSKTLQCQNVPVYKNWVEEGKTAPVQDQKQCGMQIFVIKSI